MAPACGPAARWGRFFDTRGGKLEHSAWNDWRWDSLVLHYRMPIRGSGIRWKDGFSSSPELGPFSRTVRPVVALASVTGVDPQVDSRP
jgi:hypothetical protein